jgi:hypothetical protein
VVENFPSKKAAKASDKLADVSLEHISPSSKSKKDKLCLQLASDGFLLRLIFDPEDGGDMLPRKIGTFSNYATLELGKPCPS